MKKIRGKKLCCLPALQNRLETLENAGAYKLKVDVRRGGSADLWAWGKAFWEMRRLGRVTLRRENGGSDRLTIGNPKAYS